jgi:hypothetical protein
MGSIQEKPGLAKKEENRKRRSGELETKNGRQERKGGNQR